MNNGANTKLDLIWALAAEEYVKDLILESRKPQADAVIDEYTEKKILRMIRKDDRHRRYGNVRSVFRYVLVACLIAATLALAACMAHPTIREAIWKVFLEWGDESVKISFVPPNDTDSAHTTQLADPAVTTVDTSASTTEPSDPPEPPAPEPPTSIEAVNIPTYLPVGYTIQSTIMRKAYIVDYFNANGELVITFKQMTISSGSKGDGTEGTATEVTVNGLNAVLFTYDDSSLYLLYWQDGQYRYSINGHFASFKELLRMAESVKVK